jgi:glycine oxidase
MTDFLIVGRGLAAFVVAHTLHNQGKSFQIIGNKHLSTSSRVAAGIWNPVVFKRMTQSWMAHQLVPFLLNFYKDCEEKLNTKFVYPRKIVRTFQEEQEKTLWLKKSKNELAGLISDKIENTDKSGFENIFIQGDYGEVLQAGNIDVSLFLDRSEEYFKDIILDEVFRYDQLNISDDQFSYKDQVAKSIIFCEGHLLRCNPYFDWLPMNPAKGETITVKTNARTGGNIFNRNGFIVETDDGELKCGATYEWKDLSDFPTEKGKAQLEVKLRNMISSEYTITSHTAGVRPSSSDRRPLIGEHPVFSNMFVFNGLGTKGVMLAPYFANNFVLFCIEKQELNPEADIKRFYSLYPRAR